MDEYLRQHFEMLPQTATVCAEQYERANHNMVDGAEFRRLFGADEVSIGEVLNSPSCEKEEVINLLKYMVCRFAEVGSFKARDIDSD